MKYFDIGLIGVWLLRVSFAGIFVLCGPSFAEVMRSGRAQLQQKIEPSVDLNAYADDALIVEAANEALRIRVDEIKRSTDREMNQQEAFLAKAIAIDQFNIDLHRRQLVYHPIILFAVLFLVFTATVLVIVQFWRWNRISVEESALEIGKEGLKLRTPFVGLIMLVASYAFFYLYIQKVYEIRSLEPLKDGGVSGVLMKNESREE